MAMIKNFLVMDGITKHKGLDLYQFASRNRIVRSYRTLTKPP
jgi:hypothetical protein